MELLAPAWCSQPQLCDSTFVVGVVSVMDRFLGMDMEQVVDSLGLSDELRAALLCREGELGMLLNLAESLESGDDRGVQEEVIRLHASNVGDMLNSAQGQALLWASSVVKAA